MNKKKPAVRQRARTSKAETNARVTSQGFIAHLDYASQVVQSWPEWKQRALGGTGSYAVSPTPPRNDSLQA